MLSVPPQSVENLGKVCQNSRAGENPRLRLGFQLICSRILPNVRLGFHEAMKARTTCFISFIKLLFNMFYFSIIAQISPTTETLLFVNNNSFCFSPQLVAQLTYVYNQVLSVLTYSQLSRIMEQRRNYDLRRLLSGECLCVKFIFLIP